MEGKEEVKKVKTDSRRKIIKELIKDLEKEGSLEKFRKEVKRDRKVKGRRRQYKERVRSLILFQSALFRLRLEVEDAVPMMMIRLRPGCKMDKENDKENINRELKNMIPG